MSLASAFALLSLVLSVPRTVGQDAPPPKAKAPTQAAAAAAAARKAPVKPAVKSVLEGVVKGPDAKAVPGAFVSASARFGRWEDLARTARTDAEGRFKLDLRSSEPHDVRVEARGLAAARLEKVRPGPSLIVTLGRGRTIEGVVRGEGGQPVAGARVTAHADHRASVSVWEPDAVAVRAWTDARGRFRLAGIAPGLHSVNATARGYSNASRRDVRPGASVSLVLRLGAWIAGRVLDPAGAPVKGALVRAETEGQYGYGSVTDTTDTEGRFEALGLTAGRYTVVAIAPGFAPALEPGVMVPAEGSAEVTVSLAPGAAVTGRIVDAERRPVMGQARFQALAGEPLPASAREILRASSEPDGRFRIERAPAGPLTLGVTATGFAGQRMEAEVPAREPSLDLGDIVLERGLTIHGRVRTAAGAPVAGAAINASPDDGVAEAWGRSEEDGTFLLAGLEPANHSLSVRAAGFASLRRRLAPGPESVDLVLAPGGSITGVVVEEGDRPVDSYRVVASADRANRGWSSNAGDSVGSPDGRFLLEDMEEATYVLQVFAPERTPASVSGVKVTAGRTADAGTIRVSRGGVVRGTVEDTGGNAIVGAAVKTTGPGEGRQRWMDLNTAVTDVAGAFEILGVAPGQATVEADHPQYAAGESTVSVDPAKGPSEVRLTLHQGGRIEGSARRREGMPLAGLTVETWSSSRRSFASSNRSGAVTGADGSFVLEHLPPGRVHVSLMAEAGSGQSIGTLHQYVVVREGETTRVEFVAQEILVTGRATRSGGPLAGLHVELNGEFASSYSGGSEGVPAAPAGPQHLRAVTGDDGSFALIVDAPGHYSLDVTKPGGNVHYPSREVHIPDAERHTLDLDYAGALVSGIVVDKEADLPVAGSQVFGQPKAPQGDGAGGESGPDGRFTLSLDPGEYTLRVRAEGFAEATTDITVGSEGFSDLRIALEKGLEIAGRVVDDAGRGLAGVHVGATATDGGFSGLIRTLPDGSFRFGTLKDATYAICGGNEQAGYAVRAGLKPGARSITLALRPAGHVRLLVRGPDGAPLANAYPRVVKFGGNAARIPLMGQGPSDASGQADLVVPAGQLEIEVRGEKYKGTLRISVGEGATVPAEITLTEPIG